MGRVSSTAPSIVISLDRIKERSLREQFTAIFRQIEYAFTLVRRDISAVDHQFLDQNDQPTPAEGEMLVWRDADAAAGQSKAYLVTKQNGVVYTFKSVEVV